MRETIRPSADLRNHYSEISKQCHEERRPVVITVNGRADTVIMGVQEYNQITEELTLLKTLSDAEEDVRSQGDRMAPIEDTFADLRKSLLSRGAT